MNTEGRAFPVMVDPPLFSETVGSDTTLTDTYIVENSNTNNGASTLLCIDGDTGIAYVKLNYLNQLPYAAYLSGYVTKASIALYHTDGFHTDDIAVGVYKVNSAWDESLTWSDHQSNKGTLESAPMDYVYIHAGDNNDFYTWDITEAVKEWYFGGDNNGVAFKFLSSDSYKEFYSSEASSSSSQPVFTAEYVNMTGVEDYWSYTSQSVGNAGTGSVNLANGELTFEIPLLSTTDSIMPTTVSLVYNSQLAGKAYIIDHAKYAYSTEFTSRGVKLNISETLVAQTFKEGNTNVTYYIWNDSDGTEHAFMPVKVNSTYSTTNFIDMDGLQLELTVGTNNITVKNNEITVKTFVPVQEGWALSEITDIYGSKVSFGITSVNYIPLKVSLTPVGGVETTMLTIEYANGMPSAVVDSSAKRRVNISYTQLDEHLNMHSVVSGITRIFGDENTDNYVEATSSYEYAGTTLKSATDNLTGYKVTYTLMDETVDEITGYDAAVNSKVIGITEHGGATQGQSVGIAYYTSSAEVRSAGSDGLLNNNDDLIDHRVFDNYGRAVSTYTTDVSGKTIYGATSGEYETQENVKNNLKSHIVTGTPEVNILLDGDFDGIAINGTTAWTVSGLTSVSSKAPGGSYLLFYPSGGRVGTVTQSVPLSAGKYTLTVKSYSKLLSEGLVLKASVLQGSTVVSSEILTQSYIETENETTYFNFDITASGTYTVKIEVGNTDYTGTGMFMLDDVSLTKEIGISKASLVNAGYFESSVQTYWKSSSGTAQTTLDPDGLFGNVLKVNGNLEFSAVNQKIYTVDSDTLNTYDNFPENVSPNTGETYIISGFAKASSAANSGATFRLRLELRYYQGSWTNDYVYTEFLTFDKYFDGWQFISASFSTDPEYTVLKSITVYCEYSNQAEGTYALFDGICVTEAPESSVKKYGYYPNGLLQTVSDLRNTEVYEYNITNKHVIRKANNNGELWEYVYDDYGAAVIDEVYYTFTYNNQKRYPYWLGTNASSYVTKTIKYLTHYDHYSTGLVMKKKSGPAVIGSHGYRIFTSSGEFYVTEYTYYRDSGSKIYGALESVTDNVLGTTYYKVDENTGLLLGEYNTANGIGVAYTYDAMGILTKVSPATYNASHVPTLDTYGDVDYEYTAQKYLDKITADSTSYDFTYNEFGNVTEIKAGNYTLVNYIYRANNAGLEKVIYGNGYGLKYVYDYLDNIAV